MLSYEDRVWKGETKYEMGHTRHVYFSLALALVLALILAVAVAPPRAQIEYGKEKRYMRSYMLSMHLFI